MGSVFYEYVAGKKYCRSSVQFRVRNYSDQKKIPPHKEGMGEGIIEEGNKREAQRINEVGVEAHIASNEVVAEDQDFVDDEVVVGDEFGVEDEVVAEDEVNVEDEVDVEDEGNVEDEVVAEDKVLLPDAITPSMMLIVFNIILPTVDIFLDTALVQKLFLNGYWGSGVSITAGNSCESSDNAEFGDIGHIGESGDSSES